MQLTYSRLDTLTELLVLSSQPISGQYISNKLQISERTLRNDIKNLNEKLYKDNIEIKLRRGVGYYLTSEDKILVENFKQEFFHYEKTTNLETANDRIHFLLKLLIDSTEFLSFDDLLNSLFVGKNTLYNYLATVKDILEEYDLVLLNKTRAGYYVYGEEANKRQCLINTIVDKNHPTYMINFSSYEKNLLENIDIEELVNITVPFLVKSFAGLPDHNLKNILLHLALSVSRIKKMQYITTFDFELDNLETKLLLDNILDNIEEKSDIKFFPGERNYFYYHTNLNILGLTKNSDQEIDTLINSFITEFINNIYNTFHFDFHEDKVFIENLSKHLTANLQLQNIDGRRQNPFLEVIKSSIPLAFEITLTALSLTKTKVPMIFEEDEISYIAIHLGAALERTYANRWTKKRVAIVCNSGLATASLLEIKLNNRLQDRLTVTGKYSYYEACQLDLTDNDFIISTFPLPDIEIPTINIDLANFERDFESFHNQLISGNLEKEAFWNLFSTSNIFINPDVKNQEEILKLLSNKLVSQDIVDENFEELVIQREEIATTYIGNGIAIPHPISLTAKTSRVSVAFLKEPIKWGMKNDSVTTIFMLAIHPDDSPKIQMLFDFLINIQGQSQFNRLLKTCAKPIEVLQLIRAYNFN